ncbi:MAG: type I-U CRISPR-associated helicase/endonuclease Cas3 [Phycisphaerae bacterium]
MMDPITVDQFDDYFHTLHGHQPYPWQCRLAQRAVNGGWPGAIDLPTGSGKTACIDIAIFALACQASHPVTNRTAPRRIFFCVNRRVIVDEAHTRARQIAKDLFKAEQYGSNGDPLLRKVASSLREIAGTSTGEEIPPLDVVELRGGIYRDNRWARSITQPTIVCTTLDQLGSRLLFRGYGVSPNAAPVQAALIAYDSLILLDEAHISEPFRQTLDHVHRYLAPRQWAEESIGVRPVTIVPMTATPNEEMVKRGVIRLQGDDRQNRRLLDRLTASKPAKLRDVKDVATETIEIAKEACKASPVAVGIIVNRIATARAIYNQLRELQVEPSDKKRKIPNDAVIELVIGSMRPIDRDAQAQRLRKLVGPDRPAITETPSFTVATQCLEVGADYDFDVLITECASLDALRQRFGRLNRAGRAMDARAYVLINKKDAKEKPKLKKDSPADPIYGNALAHTWNWLNKHATEETIDEKTVKRIDFGIDVFAELLHEHGENNRPPKDLLAPSASLNAPVMLPAYMDFWCQTAPRPVPDPDVSLFIHGTENSEPDVQVCWRADLIEDDHMTREQWCDVVALLPPTSAECMNLPISRVRRWLSDQMDKAQDHGDMLGVNELDDDKKNQGEHPPSLQYPGVLWRGSTDTGLIAAAGDLRPGDTLVLPASQGQSRVLGHLPDTHDGDHAPTGESQETPHPPAVNDVAETAFTRARDLAAIRLHPSLRSRLPDDKVFETLLAGAAEREEPPTSPQWRALLQAAAETLDQESPLKQAMCHLVSNGLQVEPYPDRRGVVLTGRKRLGTAFDWFIPSMDDGDDDISRVRRDDPILLTDHVRHIEATVEASLRLLPLDLPAETYKVAAKLHDLGKADERFQAMLRRTDRTDAWLLVGLTSAILAKSDGLPQTQAQRRQARQRAGLPEGFRHEMLSVQLAELSAQLPDDAALRDLVLHLVAAHHGRARPFAPVVQDDELPPVEVNGVALSQEQRRQLTPAHRLDSGIAERFWTLTRRFGWWGLAYLEAVLRLADQQASAAEDAGKYDNEPAKVTT